MRTGYLRYSNSSSHFICQWVKERRTHVFWGSKSAWPKKSEPRQSKWWCLDFQKGTCLFKGPHESFIRGSKKWVKHFCTTCIQKNRVIRYHSEKVGECPFNQRGYYSEGGGAQASYQTIGQGKPNYISPYNTVPSYTPSQWQGPQVVPPWQSSYKA